MGDVDVLVQGSTKKILSLLKNLPDGDKLESRLRAFERRREQTDEEKPKRFNSHPRKLKKPGDSFVVLKKPEPILTDSSDEYCDVTIRRDEYEMMESEEIQVADHILETVQNHYQVSKLTKITGISKSERFPTVLEKNEKPITKSDPIIKKGLPPRPKKRSSPRNLIPEEKTEKTDEEKVPKLIYLDRKLKGIIDKSLQSLEDIRVLFEYGVDPPDGDEDYQRRQKRMMEFSSRFSRIHLYDLNRHIADIQSIVKPTSGKNSGRSSALNLNQKYFSAHHTLLLGLQAYQKHLPTAIALGVPDKLRDLLKNAESLCEIYKCHSSKNQSGDANGDEIIDVLEVRCKMLLEAQQLTVSKTVVPSSSNLSIKVKGPKKKYSMYHTVPIRKDVYWRKAIASLAKKKFNVPSRYKTATYKHRPPPDSLKLQQQLSGQQEKPSTPWPSGRTLPRTPCCYSAGAGTTVREKPQSAMRPVNDIDSNVKTFLQMQNEQERLASAECCTASAASFEENTNAMWNLAQGFFRKISKDNKEMSQGEYECILEHFISMIKKEEPSMVCLTEEKRELSTSTLEQEARQLLEDKLGRSIEKMEFKEFVEKLLQCMNETTGTQPEEVPAFAEPKFNESNVNVEINECLTDLAKKTSDEKRQTVTVSGVKNAQLICIKDDSSPVERTDDEDEPDETSGAYPAPERTQSANFPQKPSSAHTRKSARRAARLAEEMHQGVADSPLPRLARKRCDNRIPLQMLPQNVICDIIEYKLQFHKETKNEYMYKKSGEMSPWIIMERIADRLMEESLQVIARDIQVDEILQKIYTNEFK